MDLTGALELGYLKVYVKVFVAFAVFAEQNVYVEFALKINKFYCMNLMQF